MLNVYCIYFILRTHIQRFFWLVSASPQKRIKKYFSILAKILVYLDGLPIAAAARQEYVWMCLRSFSFFSFFGLPLSKCFFHNFHLFSVSSSPRESKKSASPENIHTSSNGVAAAAAVTALTSAYYIIINEKKCETRSLWVMKLVSSFYLSHSIFTPESTLTRTHTHPASKELAVFNIHKYTYIKKPDFCMN